MVSNLQMINADVSLRFGCILNKKVCIAKLSRWVLEFCLTMSSSEGADDAAAALAIKWALFLLGTEA